MTKNVILTDIDGVVLNWEASFNEWMAQKKYVLVEPDAYNVNQRFNISREKSKELVRIFNESAQIGFLSPLRDSLPYMTKIHHEFGITFHCITSLSLDKCAQKLRIQNLENWFGSNVFSEYLFADTGQDKNHILKNYIHTNYIWVEDKPVNAEDGLAYGLRPYLMAHNYNLDYKHPEIKRVSSWREIYNDLKQSGF